MSLWLSIAGMVMVALVFLLTPLWRERYRTEAASILATPTRPGQRIVIVACITLLPALTAGLYYHLGAPAILKEQALTQADSRHDPEAMVKAMEEKLKSEPDDAEGWYTLGRAYIAFQQLDNAETALSKAVKLAPQDARMLAQYAEAIALKTGSLEGRPNQLVMEALEINNEEDMALELAGLAAFEKEKWAESLYYWRRLLKRLPAESEFHDAIQNAVKIAEKKIEESGPGKRAKPGTP